MKPASRLVLILTSCVVLFGGSFVSASGASAATLKAPVPTMQQIGVSTANITFPSASGASTYHVVVNQGADVVYDATSKLKTYTFPISDVPLTDYTYQVTSIKSPKTAASAVKTFTSRAATVDVRFGTFNLCSEVSHCPQFPGWSTRAAKAGIHVRASGAQVIGFQETGRIDVETKALTKALGTTYTKIAGAKSRYIYFANASISSKSWSGAALPGGSGCVQSRNDGTPECTYEIAAGLAAGHNVSKPTYFAWQMLRQKSTNSLFVTVDLHLTSKDGLTEDTDRLAELQRTVDRVKAVVLDKYPGIPVVYLGDTNSLRDFGRPDCESETERGRVDGYFHDNGFTDARRVAESVINGDVVTLHDAPEVDRALCTGFQLEHIYAADSVRVVDWQIWDDSPVFSERISDHDLLTSTLAVPTF